MAMAMPSTGMLARPMAGAMAMASQPREASFAVTLRALDMAAASAAATAPGPALALAMDLAWAMALALALQQHKRTGHNDKDA